MWRSIIVNILCFVSSVFENISLLSRICDLKNIGNTYTVSIISYEHFPPSVLECSSSENEIHFTEIHFEANFNGIHLFH